MEDKRKQYGKEETDSAIRDYLFKLKVQERLELDAIDLAEARGHQHGMEEGHKEAINNIALNMHKEGISKETICAITDLTEEELDNILNKKCEGRLN